MTNFPFSPTGATVVLSATTATAAASLAPWTLSGGSLRVTNASNNLAFIQFGGTGASVTGGMPILPNSVELFTVGDKETSVSTIAVGTAALYFTPGQGGV
jgi:hypothetical protein